MTKRIQEPRVRTLLRLLGLPARPPAAGEPGARLARAVARHHGPLPDRLGRRIERLVELRHRARDDGTGTAEPYSFCHRGLQQLCRHDRRPVRSGSGSVSRCAGLASPSSEGRHADSSLPSCWQSIVQYVRSWSWFRLARPSTRPTATSTRSERKGEE